MFEEDDYFKVDKALELLGIENIENIENKRYVLNEISNYVFGKQDGYTTKIKEKNFDINLDYEYYFPDFLKYGINLNKQDIDWWEFQKILNSIMLNKDSTISTIISFRTYEKSPKNLKTQEEREHKFRMEMKRKYSLPNSQKIENGFDKMWNYVEKKVGVNKE